MRNDRNITVESLQKREYDRDGIPQQTSSQDKIPLHWTRPAIHPLYTNTNSIEDINPRQHEISVATH